MTFTQTMTVQAESAQSLVELLDGWHREQAGVAPGYRRARLLEDQQRPNRYVIEVDFFSQEAAQENSARPETQAWAERLGELTSAEPEYHDYTEVYTTG